MATIIDQLALELGLNTRPFTDALRGLEQSYRSIHEGTRRQFEEHENRLSKLGALIGGITRGFGALIIAAAEVSAAVVAMSRPIAQAGTEMKNLADAAGTDITTFDAWGRAMQRVGGDAKSMQGALVNAQAEFQKAAGPGGGLPFGAEGFAYLQRLGITNWRQYLNPATGQYNVDRFYKDVADAMARKNLSDSERSLYLSKLGVNDPAAQRLFQGDLRSRLEAARTAAMTEQNAAAFQRLTAQWVELGNTAVAVGRDLVTKFEEPITKVLNAMISVLNLIRGTGPLPAVPGSPAPTGMSPPTRPEGARPAPEPTAPRQNWLGSPLPGSGGRLGTGGVPPPTGMTPPAPSPPTFGTPPPVVETPGGATMVGPRTGIRRGSVPAVPYSPPAVPGTTSSPAAPSTQQFYDPLTGAPMPGPQSSLPSSNLEAFTSLPQRVAAYSATPASGSVMTNNNSNVTIGGLTFNSRTVDTEMGAAPSNVARELSIGQGSVHYNESLE